MVVPLIAASGAAIDYSLATSAQAKLNQAAQIAAVTAAATARNVVNGYVTTTTSADSSHDAEAITEGQRSGLESFTSQAGLVRNLAIDLSNTTVIITRTSNILTATLNYRAQWQTTVMKAYGVSTINLSGTGSSILGISDRHPANPITKGADYDLVIDEAWKANGTNVNNRADLPVYNDWYSGTVGTKYPVLTSSEVDSITPLNNTNVTGAIRIGDPTGAMAPIISKKIYLNTGSYELRYLYKSTLVYPDYEPIYVCGTVETEMDWVKSGLTRTLASEVKSAAVDGGIRNAQTARAGVYLTPITTNPQIATPAPVASSFNRPPPLAAGNLNITRLDNSSYRIDICAYSSRWIERKIPINITKAGYFWLTFLAEPPSNYTMNGFFLGPVKLCASSCSSTPYNNSPWTSYNVGTHTAGTVLFQDSFDTPPNKNQGDNFDLTSGTVPSDAKYESPINHWMVLDRASNGISVDGTTVTSTSDFNYGTNSSPSAPKDGAQFLRSNNVKYNSLLIRRLLLLPGFYRVKMWAADQPTEQGCDSLASTGYRGYVARQDWQTQPAVPATTPSDFAARYGLSLNLPGKDTQVFCGAWTQVVRCYFLAGTQFYDFGIGPNLVSLLYRDTTGKYFFANTTFDQFSIEYMSDNVVGGYPDSDTACSAEYKSGRNTNKRITTLGIGGSVMWPGYTQKTFSHYTITAPRP